MKTYEVSEKLQDRGLIINVFFIMCFYCKSAPQCCYFLQGKLHQRLRAGTDHFEGVPKK